MRVSFLQIITLLIITFLLFGDTKKILKTIKEKLTINRKKGT